MLDKLKKNLQERRETQEKRVQEQAVAQKKADEESKLPPIDILDEKPPEAEVKPAEPKGKIPEPEGKIPEIKESLYVIAVAVQNIEVYLGAMFAPAEEEKPAEKKEVQGKKDKE